MTIGENIRKLRQRTKVEKPMSQVDLGEKVGMSGAEICNLEKGRRVGCLKNIAKIAATFGVTIDELVNGSFHD